MVDIDTTVVSTVGQLRDLIKDLDGGARLVGVHWSRCDIKVWSDEDSAGAWVLCVSASSDT